MNCLVLPHRTSDGPTNMAFDEALLDAVDADPTVALLRTYEWSRPTLSLGYFQRIAEVESDARWHGVDVVRRPTGGGAIWHHHDLTYAIVLPKQHPCYTAPGLLYRTVHDAISEALGQLGVEVHRMGEVSRKNRRDRPFLCFTDRDCEDIVKDDVKIAGSSQRRRPFAVLQHGSVLLARSSTAQELQGLGEITGRHFHPEELADGIRRTIPSALNLSPIENSDDARWMERLNASKPRYLSRQWTARR